MPPLTYHFVCILISPHSYSLSETVEVCTVASSRCDKLTLNTLVMDIESWMQLCFLDDDRDYRWVAVVSVFPSGGRCCLEQQLGGRHYKSLIMVDNSKGQK